MWTGVEGGRETGWVGVGLVGVRPGDGSATGVVVVSVLADVAGGVSAAGEHGCYCRC